jgi:uncharacterized membrane protein YeaQ/YmgE (transglycosylase-associated protein family)
VLVRKEERSMDFGSFLVLLIISVVVAAILHYGIDYRVDPGVGSFLSKVVWGFVGARFGTRAFGRWWEGLSYGDIFYVPAILGSIAILIVAVDFFQTATRVLSGVKN